MIDFLMISTRSTKRGVIEIYPKFVITRNSSDLMIRGGDFYAVWVEERGLWSTDEYDALQIIDRELDRYAEENKVRFHDDIKVLHMWDAETGMIDAWHKYCQKQMRDSFHMLDEKLIFFNTNTDRKDYASKRLPYPLESGAITAYEELISTLYTPEERHKLEWAIGAIVSGDSKKIQKFMVLYGSHGTGKSTILNIIQKLFDGYSAVFDAKALGTSSNSFALEAFKTNPLVAIQHDGDLSKIEDNTRLNSLVSHELMTVNEKFKSTYANQFKCFLFMGTNRPVKITDAKSGLIRRLIDVSPSGNTIETSRYDTLIGQIDFELGGIAYYCQQVYLENPSAYNSYIPIAMMGASNDFYNFVVNYYQVFVEDNCTSLKVAWEMYKFYCDDAKVSFPFSQRVFKEELKNYFNDYKERFTLEDGTRVRNYYSGFRLDRFEGPDKEDSELSAVPKNDNPSWICLKTQDSIFDAECSDCLSQYASAEETPLKKWDSVKTSLASLDTKKLHYVKVPENHIVIDFDIPDEDGNKSLEANLKAATLFPPTYAEVSKGGAGLHLHYIYTGDPNKLSRIYDDHIEVKVYTGKSSLRRKLSTCNDLAIASISSGLPLRGEKVVSSEVIKSEKGLRTSIKKALNKEIHPGTKPNMDFIYKILTDAYDSGMHYDVTDMVNDVIAFAAGSSHQSGYCLKLVGKIPFKSEDISVSLPDIMSKDVPLVFFDVEVFPNLFLINLKAQGKGKPMVRYINPSPMDIEHILKLRLVGFNCRRYDNHMLYACLMGFNNEQIYNQSQKIINQEPGAYFSEAYNISYTDIYDFAAAVNKQSLKKFEIQLGIHHHELGLPWDEPVPKEKWEMVAEYCDDDVYATEDVFDYLKSDWIARQILADITGMTVNDTTNSLSINFIFGSNKKPQNNFNYRDLSKPVRWDNSFYERYGKDKVYRIFNEKGQPTYRTYKPGDSLPMGYSILPFFPGYEFKYGKSTYRGIDVGEGGEVYAEPGMYGFLALLDIASQHPTSLEEEVLFGVEHTKRFSEIKQARIFIKHGDIESAKKMMDGKLAKYLDSGLFSPDDLANALKTVINSIYGLTCAHFENPCADPRNKDNIVAKRGALFMINLLHEVQEKGFKVAHIKTDSIKIPDATPEIIDFVMKYAAEYGYIFEHEATYDRMCLVNNAVYIAKYATVETCEKLYGYTPKDNKKHPGDWTATGTQFAVPYVFKKLFSGEPIEFKDLCEVKQVKTAIYLDLNEPLPDGTFYEKEIEKLKRDLKNGKITEMQFDEGMCVLKEGLSECHDYRFIGKVGQFCPMKHGHGAGLLVREKDGNYYAVTGTKGYRWMESEVVEQLGLTEHIDTKYYDELVDAAVHTIAAYGDFTWFTSSDPYIPPTYVEPETSAQIVHPFRDNPEEMPFAM